MFRKPENNSKHMIKQGLCMVMLMIGINLSMVCAAAEQVPVVCLTDQNAFVYYENDQENKKMDSILLDGFSGMAPGEERTQMIHLKNESMNTVCFYIAQETLQSLEEENQAAGGAYRFDLSVGKRKENATSLLHTKVGGYDSEGNRRGEGLAEIDELKEETFLAKVKKGEQITLFVTLKLEGEGNDNRKDCDYSRAVARIGMRFLAKDAVKDVLYGDTKEVVTYKTRFMDTIQTGFVKTSDQAPYGCVIFLFAAGFMLLVAAVRNRRGKAKK